MRPSILFPLFAELTSLPGIGPALGKLMRKLVGEHVVDLLWHLPSGVIARTPVASIAELEDGQVATVTVIIDQHLPPSGPKRPTRIRCRDASGYLHLTYFNVRSDYLEKAHPAGVSRVVSGRVEFFNAERQIAHPDYLIPPAQAASIPLIDPIHPLTAGLPGKTLRKSVLAALDKAPDLAEWHDPALLAQRGWPGWRAALTAVHQPDSTAALAPDQPARQRLAYDELLANQLALTLLRQSQRARPGRVLDGGDDLRARALAALPFELTGPQQTALAEIDADLGAERRMMRLLQGDVGSGKTVVALMAMLRAVGSGAQAALMAPTEILARQHLATITPLAAAAGVPIAALTGRDKGKGRAAILAGLADGRIPLVVGTHALIQEDVVFHDLALAVIDEQHRFGVSDRMALTAKGRAVDVLAMTATPIPRSLLLCAYGDLDASRLTGKPPGRQPVKTVLLSEDRLDEVEDALARKLAAGERVYWVCPLVEESEEVDLIAATTRFEILQNRFGSAVALLHGRMKPTEKDAAMAEFAAGTTQILVATTVIEVGVNVPEATVTIVEQAERFGLAQLHQLRGRVGRGSAASTCILVWRGPLGETAKARLTTLRDTDDGFVIAEADLKLRGGGEVLGTRQSGLLEFRLADLAVHEDLLAMARDDANLIVARDPTLHDARGQALRVLLHLFERDAAARWFLRAG